MFCGSCGKEITDGSEFCSHCGVGQGEGAPIPASATAGMIARAASAEFKGFHIGERFILIGAAVATIGFFLPWADVVGQKVNGLGMVKLWGGVLLLLALPLASILLLYRGKAANIGQKMVLAGVQILIGAMFGPQLVVAMLLVPMANSALASGAWGIGLGYLAILVGGFLVLQDLAKVANA